MKSFEFTTSASAGSTLNYPAATIDTFVPGKFGGCLSSIFVDPSRVEF
jgi:hypothetical protein